MSTTKHLALGLSSFSSGQLQKLGSTVYPSEVPGAKSFQAETNAAYVVDGEPCPACAGKHRAHTCGKGKSETGEDKDTVEAEKEHGVKAQPGEKVEAGRDEQPERSIEV